MPNNVDGFMPLNFESDSGLQNVLPGRVAAIDQRLMRQTTGVVLNPLQGRLPLLAVLLGLADLAGDDHAVAGLGGDLHVVAGCQSAITLPHHPRLRIGDTGPHLLRFVLARVGRRLEFLLGPADPLQAFLGGPRARLAAGGAQLRLRWLLQGCQLLLGPRATFKQSLLRLKLPRPAAARILVPSWVTRSRSARPSCINTCSRCPNRCSHPASFSVTKSDRVG